MASRKHPTTQALRQLRACKATFSLHAYPYVDKGGTAAAAKALGVDEHRVIKTLVMASDRKEPFLILMHGDRSVSEKRMARTLGVKAVGPCEPRQANMHTGYQVGGISPFGTRKALCVYAEASIFELATIFINAGKRGLLMEISPAVLVAVLGAEAVQVAI